MLFCFLTLITGNSEHSNVYLRRQGIVRFKLTFCLKETGKGLHSCEEVDLTFSWHCHIMMEKILTLSVMTVSDSYRVSFSGTRNR